MPIDTAAAALTPQTASELREIVEDYLNRRGVRSNWLCGLDLLLAPPFEFDVLPGPDASSRIVMITGGDVATRARASHRFPCTHVTTGAFREDILFTLNGQPPTFRRLVPLQPARVKLLNLIPIGGSLSNGEFREATRKSNGEVQGEATRRWRELGWEFGFSAYEDSGNYYRGTSPRPVRDPLPRPNMTALTKAMLPKLLDRGDEHVCAKCTRPIQLPGTEGDLFPGVIDHRRPVAFGGSDELDNLQLFCRQCNNTKAHTCRNCPLNYECERCTWAFPRRFLDTLTVYLTPSEVSAVSAMAAQTGEEPDRLARRILRDALVHPAVPADQ